MAAIDIWGGLSREIHVDLQATKLKALGISTDEILAALRNENRNIPAGLYEKGDSEVLMRTQGEFTSLEEIEEVAGSQLDPEVVKVFKEVFKDTMGFEEECSLDE